MSEIHFDVLKELAANYGLSHVVLLAHDGKTDQVVTYGVSVLESAQAAAMGNRMKDALDWPKSLHAMSSRAEKVVQAAGDFVHNVEHSHIENASSFVGDESFKQLVAALKVG